MSVKHRYNKYTERFNDGISNFFMMFLSDKLIGVSIFGKSFVKDYPNDGENTAIYIDSEYIGKGYGHILFVEIEKILIKKGYKYLVLDVFTENTRAYNFYLKHGYKKVADSSIKFGEDDYSIVVMRKRAAL